MPIPVTPGIIPLPFAQNGQKNTIPEQGGATTDPSASWNAGFPPITMINKQAGGKPPYGMDFNGIFNALSQHIFFSQSGCVYPWMGADEETEFAGLNYLKGSHVLGSDGEEYVALKPSGPDVPASAGGFVGPVDPVGDDSGAWAKAASVYAPLATATTPGIVKPDGTTITVDGDGEIRAVTAMPVGVVLPMAGNVDMDGWLFCNGAAVSRTTYAALFAVIGTLYGAGDGSTTFNLPDLTDRFIQGSGTAGTLKMAGLPNIIGSIAGFVCSPSGGTNIVATGAFQTTELSIAQMYGNANAARMVPQFNAALSHTIYGNSDTVQPAASTMRYYIKY